MRGGSGREAKRVAMASREEDKETDQRDTETKQHLLRWKRGSIAGSVEK
jgi:hypothetical protein